MDLEQAVEEVSNIGVAYFFDDLDRFTPDEIRNRIEKEILETTKLQGLHYSEMTRDAYYFVLKNLDDDKLNEILENEYNLFPRSVGGGRAFFQQIADMMDKAIREIKPKLSR